MKILDFRIAWNRGVLNSADPVILIDHPIAQKDKVWTTQANSTDPGPTFGTPRVYVWEDEGSGLFETLVDNGSGEGFYGSVFVLNVRFADGVSKEVRVKGPFNSGSSMGMDCLVAYDRKSWDLGYTLTRYSITYRKLEELISQDPFNKHVYIAQNEYRTARVLSYKGSMVKNPPETARGPGRIYLRGIDYIPAFKEWATSEQDRYARLLSDCEREAEHLEYRAQTA